MGIVRDGIPGIVWSQLRRAASEGSLLLTVADNLGAERSRRGGKGRGKHERAGKGLGEGPGVSLERNHERIRRHDFEGGGGEVSESSGEE